MQPDGRTETGPGASTYDLLHEQVKDALVRGEACCHVNDKEWTREYWDDALAALTRLREEIDYAR